MQILLDECLPKDLRKLLSPHQIDTVREKGWSGISNGELLKLAQQNNYEVFITVDQNLSIQNPNAVHQLIVIVLHAPSNRVADLQPLVPGVVNLLSSAPFPGVYHFP